MNISIVGSSDSYKSNSIFAGKLPVLQNVALKSTLEKAERQQKTDSQIAFWEKQKENLKNMECDNVEDIAKKLEMLHDYEDEISAVKAAYNHEQMFHILDEAEEQGEKIAEAVEKMEPKTPEERRKEQVEEALGTDEDKGMLEEMLEETTDELKETTDALEEMTEAAEETKEELEKLAGCSEEAAEGAAEVLEEAIDVTKESECALEEPADVTKKESECALEEPTDVTKKESKAFADIYNSLIENDWKRRYRGVDIRI